jgi:hypothetical protein
MGATGCLSNSCQFDSSAYANVTIYPHSLSGQASPCLRSSLTADLADALGLMCGRHCQPRPAGEWRSREAGRSWASGLPLESQGPGEAHLKSEMRCNQDMPDETWDECVSASQGTRDDKKKEVR